MNTKSKMAINEFSILTGISKDSLRFYDKIGLLSPEYRGNNGYRYYSDTQIEMAFLISDLRAIGIGLDEIKNYANKRSPERMLNFFDEQNARIEEEIKRLRSIQELMKLRSIMAKQALKHEEDVVMLEKREKEPIFICPILDKFATEAERVTLTYNNAVEHNVNITFPVGEIMLWEDIEKCEGNINCSQYYFKVKKKHNTWKREGTYVVMYRRVSSSTEENLYKPLVQFIRENNLIVDGCVYVEYPLDELSESEWESYILKAEVCVKINS